jgi:hypothetical protein
MPEQASIQKQMEPKMLVRRATKNPVLELCVCGKGPDDEEATRIQMRIHGDGCGIMWRRVFEMV